jgi:hypothetical protein
MIKHEREGMQVLSEGFKYGYSAKAWEAAKSEAREIMIKRAKLRGMIPYSDLTNKIAAIKFDAHSRQFFHFLGEISADEDTEGRGMLTVLVVHKSGDMQPGPGFY